MARLTGYPGLPAVLNGEDPHDPMTTVETDAEATRVTIRDGDLTVSVLVEPDAQRVTLDALADTVVTTGPGAGLLRLTEPVVQRVNTLLRGSGWDVRPDWRSGTHTLRSPDGARSRLVPGNEYLLGWEVTQTAQTQPRTAAPGRPPVAPTVMASAATTGDTVVPPSRLGSGAFDGEVSVPAGVTERWAMARSLRESGAPSVLILQGPPGTGKTHMAMALAAAEGRTVTVVDCFGMNEPMDWFGRVGFADGRTTFIPTPLYWALTMPGPRTIVLDEFNRSSEQAQNALMPMLGGFVTFTTPHDGQQIVIPPDVAFVLTANVGAKHTGTTVVDAAVWDRVAVTSRVPYLDPAVEAQLLFDRVASRGGALPVWAAEALVRFAGVTRLAEANDGGVTGVSTRQLIATSTVYGRMGGDLFEVVRGMILDRYDDAGGDLSEATIATGLAAGMLWTEPQPEPVVEPDVEDVDPAVGP
jgi:hypothetical protein